MKVLNVNMSLDPIKGGGTVERTLQISRHLSDCGIDCTILATNAGLEDSDLRRTTLDGLNVVLLDCFNKRFYLPYPNVSVLSRLVQETDVINLMGHWTVLNALIIRLAEKYRKPYTVCPAGALPVVGRSRLLKRLYNLIIGNRIIKKAAACIAIASNEKEQFAAYGVAADRITLLPNGITPGEYQNSDDASFRKRYSLTAAPYILFVGRLNWIKGPDLLLEAFAESGCATKGIQLVIAGPDGGLLDELRRMAQHLGIAPQVHFIGHIAGELKSQAYHGATLLVIPSRLEAMSIVALEAGICGTPVLLTDQCGFDEVATIGGGSVVAAESGSLAKALQQMLADGPTLQKAGQRLKAHVAEHYLWSIAARRYADLLLTLVDQKSRQGCETQNSQAG